jgi:hypothetical protein
MDAERTNHARGFRQHPISSGEEFVGCIRDLGYDDQDPWYRGHWNSRWPLVPLVRRAFDEDVELTLLLRFSLFAGTRHQGRSPDRGDLAGWMSLAQHYGLPTRLLDWSRSPPISLWFAMTETGGPAAVAMGSRSKSESAAVWVLRPLGVNRTFLKQEAVLPLSANEFEELTAHLRIRHTYAAVSCYESDPRMAMQQATFTLHGSKHPLERHESVGTWLDQIVVDSRARETITQDLWRLGIRRSTLFPDLTSLADELANDPRIRRIKELAESNTHTAPD